MSEPLYFEDVQEGQTWTSPSRTVTESDVVSFATITGDYNPLHMDHEYAKNTHFGKPIAHGLLGVSWVAGLGSNYPNMNTVAFISMRNWNFVKPMFFGDTVHVLTEVIEKIEKGRRHGRVLWLRKLINQNGDVVQEGTFETIVHTRRAAVKRPHFSQSRNLNPE